MLWSVRPEMRGDCGRGRQGLRFQTVDEGARDKGVSERWGEFDLMLRSTTLLQGDKVTSVVTVKKKLSATKKRRRNKRDEGLGGKTRYIDD